MAAPSRRAFVLLLGDGHDQVAAQVLRLGAPGALIADPPVTGVAFFTADGAAGRALDEWYRHTDLGDEPPILLLWHDPELPAWIPGVDAEFWVAVPDQGTREIYRGRPNVHPVPTWDARELADRAAASVRPPTPTAPPAAARPAPAPSTAIVPVPPPPPSTGPAGLLSRMLARLPLPLPGRARAGAATLGTRLAGAPSTCIAVLGRPGGGPSGSAAALAAVLGEEAAPLGQTVALVDGHLGEPADWPLLGLRGAAPTLLALSTALREGRPAPAPGYGATPALLLYPESPQAAAGYTPADLHRTSEHLRRQHRVVVVDLPPGVPGTVDAATATRAAWLAEADVVVLVTGADQRSLAATALELQAEWLRGRRIVGCVTGRRPRAGRDQPDAVALHQTIGAHVARLVELPDDDTAALTILRRAGPPPAAARAAYARLAEAALDLAGAP